MEFEEKPTEYTIRTTDPSEFRDMMDAWKMKGILFDLCLNDFKWCIKDKKDLDGNSLTDKEVELIEHILKHIKDEIHDSGIGYILD